VWKGKTMMVRWLPGVPRKAGLVEQHGFYFGTYASTKLHKSAVKRNYMRRRVREAFRTFVKNDHNLPTAQLLVTPKIASLDAPFELIQSDVQTFLSVLPKWPNPKAKIPVSSITE
jgi:RNase P protein component